MIFFIGLKLLSLVDSFLAYAVFTVCFALFFLILQHLRGLSRRSTAAI